MEVEFDKKICLSNIYYLAKEKGLKLGELENEAGVSAGYISRINKDESTANPSIDFLVNVASALQVTVDALISHNFEELTATEAYLTKFIDKLITETVNNDLGWECEKKSVFDNVGLDRDNEPEHPLFTIYEYSEVGNEGYPEFYERVVYNSQFHEIATTAVVGDCFKLSMPDNAILYLMSVGATPEGGLPYENHEYEMYLFKKWVVSPLCHTVSNENAPYNKLLGDLYSAVVESSKHPTLKPDVKSVLDSFMRGNTKPQALADIEDGELPF